MAFLIMPSTIAKRKKEVVEIRKNGIKLMDDSDSSKPMDELKLIGPVILSGVILKKPWAIK